MKRRILKFLILFIWIKCFLPCDYLLADEWRRYTTKDGLVNNVVRCIVIDKDSGEIWFGTRRGVSRFNRKKWINYTTKDGLISNEVNSILIDGDYVWFGTRKGLSRFNKKTEQWIRYGTRTKKSIRKNRINALTINRGSIWIGTEKGLNRFDKKKGIFSCYTKKDGLFHNKIRSIIQDGECIIVGTVGAVINVFDLTNNKWTVYSPKDLIYSNVVLARESGSIWCGTNGGGIRVYSKTDRKWKGYTTKDGLVDNFVQAIAVDGRYMWIGTFDGVSRFDIFKEQWRNFSSEDGLVDDSVSAIAIDGEYVWFGTDSGVNRYKKEVPQVSIDLAQNYFTHFVDSLKIDCFCFSYKGIKEVEVEYNSASFPDVWLKEGIKVNTGRDKRGGYLRINWDFGELPSFNDSYNLRLTVCDKEGKFNSSLATVTIDIGERMLKERVARLSLHEMVFFNLGSAQIKKRGFKILEKVISVLQKYPEAKIKIEGHTDNIPIRPRCIYRTNLELSNARVESVFRYLVNKSRISSDRFLLKGYGESRPISSNATPKGRAKNRRVEVIVTLEE